MTQKTAFDLQKQDRQRRVHPSQHDGGVKRENSAPFPCRSPPKPAIPSLSGAKFGREPLRSARFRRLKPPQIVAAYWPKTTETGAV